MVPEFKLVAEATKTVRGLAKQKSAIQTNLAARFEPRTSTKIAKEFEHHKEITR
jgi:hypothetical protein